MPSGQPKGKAAGQNPLDRAPSLTYTSCSELYVAETKEDPMATAAMNIHKTVSATDLRDRLKDCLKAARNNQVVLIENRRQSSKYLVDKEFLDMLVEERDSIFATLEILADRDLTDRLLDLSKTIDRDVASGRLLTTADVFGR
jgi:hypothetical protein